MDTVHTAIGRALHRSLRKIVKTRGSFPNDDAALKLLYLAIKNAGLRWRRGVEWTAAMGQFAIQPFQAMVGIAMPPKADNPRLDANFPGDGPGAAPIRGQQSTRHPECAVQRFPNIKLNHPMGVDRTFPTSGRCQWRSQCRGAKGIWPHASVKLVLR